MRKSSPPWRAFQYSRDPPGISDKKSNRIFYLFFLITTALFYIIIIMFTLIKERVVRFALFLRPVLWPVTVKFPQQRPTGRKLQCIRRRV